MIEEQAMVVSQKSIVASQKALIESKLYKLTQDGANPILIDALRDSIEFYKRESIRYAVVKSAEAIDRIEQEFYFGEEE